MCLARLKIFTEGIHHGFRKRIQPRTYTGFQEGTATSFRVVH